MNGGLSEPEHYSEFRNKRIESNLAVESLSCKLRADASPRFGRWTSDFGDGVQKPGFWLKRI